MTDEQATKALLAHFVHRMNEFFHENPAEEIDKGKLGEYFARWLYGKECRSPAFKTAEGVIAQHFSREQVLEDGESLTMARLKLYADRGVSFLWLADLWVNPAMAIPDELREEIVKTLRFHADKVESRDIDLRLKEIYKSATGVT